MATAKEGKAPAPRAPRGAAKPQDAIAMLQADHRKVSSCSPI